MNSKTVVTATLAILFLITAPALAYPPVAGVQLGGGLNLYDGYEGDTSDPQAVVGATVVKGLGIDIQARLRAFYAHTFVPDESVAGVDVTTSLAEYGVNGELLFFVTGANYLFGGLGLSHTAWKTTVDAGALGESELDKTKTALGVTVGAGRMVGDATALELGVRVAETTHVRGSLIFYFGEII